MAENKIIEWEAPEFDYIEKEPFWYLTGAIAALALFAVAIYQRNLLFVIFIIVASFLVYVLSKQKPQTLRFKINENGVKVGSYKLYTYDDLEGFSILKEIGEAGFDELILKQENRINPFIKIKMPENKTEEVRAFLLNYLDEVENSEGLPDALSRFIKF